MAKINWKRSSYTISVSVVATETFEKWLRDQGHREEGVLTYTRAIKLFLKRYPLPSIEDAREYHGEMVESSLARSTVNIRGSALKAFFKFKGEILDLPHMKINNKIPYFFGEEEIGKIFNSMTNIKHFAMFSLMYNCMLRVNDICNLEDEDLNLRNLTLRIRDGKFGKPALLPIPPDCGRTLEEYLRIRGCAVLAQTQIDGKYPLFYSDLKNKFNRRSVCTLFHYYKRMAGVNTPGGCHVFGRHSPASILIKNGCDVYSLQQLMRHSSINTTARYLHTDLATLREKQNKYLDI